MDKQYEQIILAEWFYGKNREDMKLFVAKDFPHYAKLFAAMQEKGAGDIVGICQETEMSVSEISEFLSLYFPTSYETGIRQLLSEKARAWISQNPGKSPAEIAKKMSDFTVGIKELPEHSKNPAFDFLDEMDRRCREKMISTGLTQLDELLFGIRTGELTFVGARPSVGKSAFLLQMAIKVAEQGKKILYLSLEMSEMAMWQRIFMRYSDTPTYMVRRGIQGYEWNEDRQRALNKMNELYQSGNFVLISGGRDIGVIKELVKIHKPYMLLVDQLQQMDDRTKNFKDIRSRFADMTHELQTIALEQDIAVWCACQINRSANDIVPTLANLKEAGNIEEDATNVILLHRLSEKTELQEVQCELAKQKEGACGEFILNFNAPRFTFLGTTNM